MDTTRETAGAQPAEDTATAPRPRRKPPARQPRAVVGRGSAHVAAAQAGLVLVVSGGSAEPTQQVLHHAVAAAAQLPLEEPALVPRLLARSQLAWRGQAGRLRAFGAT